MFIAKQSTSGSEATMGICYVASHSSAVLADARGTRPQSRESKTTSELRGRGWVSESVGNCQH